MLRNVAKKIGKPAGKPRGRKPGPKVAASVPAGIAKRGPGRPPKAATGTGSIEAMVSELVESRVREVLGRAISVLEKLRG
jgi:hypothetical protein